MDQLMIGIVLISMALLAYCYVCADAGKDCQREEPEEKGAAYGRSRNG